MNNIKLLLGAFIFFLLGFIANEYVHYSRMNGLEIDGQTKTALDSRVDSSLMNSANNIHDAAALAINSSPLLSTQEGLGLPTGSTVISNPSLVDEFSWERVNRLIANENFDEAIRLLQGYLEINVTSAKAWLLLAQIFQKQKKHRPAFDAWFHYLNLERDAQKIDQAFNAIKNYLLVLNATPSMFGDDVPWLIAQIDKLLQVNTNDGELQLMLATLYLAMDDTYQAQYHALMAVNDPAVQKQAEEILAKLNGKKITEDVMIPLLRYGNQYLIGMSIEGHPARLLLDTGASLSGVSKTFAAKYPSIVKATKPIRLNTASGTVDSYLFTVNDLRFGSVVFEQHILTLLPMESAEEFDGLLGVDILGRFDFVIDQDELVLRLRARKNK